MPVPMAGDGEVMLCLDTDVGGGSVGHCEPAACLTPLLSPPLVQPGFMSASGNG